MDANKSFTSRTELVCTAQFIMNNGKFLGSKLSNEYLVDLYRCGDFYGRLYYRPDNGRIDRLDLSEEPTSIERYLSFQS